jgi:hypothetical protein
MATFSRYRCRPSFSESYVITTIVTDQRTVRVHHTEYVMPENGMLFANDHDVGRNFTFDVREPLHPKIMTSFTDMAGYMLPHSYLRLAVVAKRHIKNVLNHVPGPA